MPIDGLTTNLEHEMPRLGQLRKGAPKPKGDKKPGVDLTYFRFVCHDPRITANFERAYGKEPRCINVHLPFPGMEQNFPTWREEHGAGSLKHRCDGKTMVLWQDKEGLYHTEPKPCPYAHLPKGDPDRKCKQTGLLRVFIDELGEWGYVDVVTGGKWDCIGLTKNVLEIENMARLASSITGRRIGVQGIPCQLKRAPRMTSCPPLDGKGPRVRLEKWMLYLYVAPGYIQALMNEMNRYSLPVVDLPRLAAPASDVEIDYYAGNGDEEIEQAETEVVEEKPATNGRKYNKADFIARIHELMAEAEALGQPRNIDQAILDEATLEDLKAIGKDLAAYVAALKTEGAKQETLL